MTPKFTVLELFTLPREQPTGEVIIDEVVRILRTQRASWPKQVARQLGVKTAHLSGAITLLTGQSLEKMIKEWRMLQAMYLIRHTDKSFGEIAHLCGFAQAKTLAQAMERSLHMSPYEYRYGRHREEIRKYRKKEF